MDMNKKKKDIEDELKQFAPTLLKLKKKGINEKIPDTFLNEINRNVILRMQKRRNKIINMRIISSVAASILIIFFMIFKKNIQNLTRQKNYVYNDSLEYENISLYEIEDYYVSMRVLGDEKKNDDDEIINYLIYNDITINDIIMDEN